MNGEVVNEKVLRVALDLSTKKFKNQIAGVRGYISQLKKTIAGLKGELAGLTDKFKKTEDSTQSSEAAMSKWLGVGLSLMFISQGIASAMGRLMSPVMELVGIFDIWRATLISFLAPVLIPFSMLLIKIMMWLMTAPKWFKILAGSIVLIIFAIASVVAAMAPWFLLLKALAGPGALGFLSTFCGAFKKVGLCSRAGLAKAAGFLTTWFLPILLAVIAVVGFLAAAWKFLTEEDKAKKWARGIMLFLSAFAVMIAVTLGAPVALAAAIGGAVAYLSSLVITHWESILDWFKNNWTKTLTRTLLAPFQPFLMVLKYTMKLLDKFAGTRISGSGFGKALEFAAFQEGGIVTKPTLGLIGESGPEAVIPLTGGSGINININVQGAFGSSSDARNTASAIQSALRDELRRLGVR